jgi:hypothetical protein
MLPCRAIAALYGDRKRAGCVDAQKQHVGYSQSVAFAVGWIQVSQTGVAGAHERTSGNNGDSRLHLVRQYPH